MVADGAETWPAELPSLFKDEPVVNQLGPLGRRSTFLNGQGLQLASYFWPAASPKAAVMLCHGNGAYVMEFLKTQGPGKPVQYKGSWIERMNQAGISVAGFDMQSCGFSEGVRGHGCRSFFESFDDIIADAVQFRRLLSETDVPGYTGLPVFIAGISMGGHVALQVMRRNADLFKGAVLLAPMVSLEKVSRAGLNPYLLPLSKLVSWLFPAWQVAKVNRNPLYPDLQLEWDSDPLNFQGNTRARCAAEYLRVTRELLPCMHELNFPWICFHGEDDTLCDPDGSKQLLEASQSEDKELVTMPKMWHVLIKEPGNEKVITRMIEWMSNRV